MSEKGWFIFQWNWSLVWAKVIRQIRWNILPNYLDTWRWCREAWRFHCISYASVLSETYPTEENQKEFEAFNEFGRGGGRVDRGLLYNPLLSSCKAPPKLKLSRVSSLEVHESRQRRKLPLKISACVGQREFNRSFYFLASCTFWVYCKGVKMFWFWVWYIPDGPECSVVR